jgi:hypothetical protein
MKKLESFIAIIKKKSETTDERTPHETAARELAHNSADARTGARTSNKFENDCD